MFTILCIVGFIYCCYRWKFAGAIGFVLAVFAFLYFLGYLVAHHPH